MPAASIIAATSAPSPRGGGRCGGRGAMLPWRVCFPPTTPPPLSATFSFPLLLTLPSLPFDDGPSHLRELTPPALAPFARYRRACSAPGAGCTWPWYQSGVRGWLVRRPQGWVAATTASCMTRAVAASRCGGEGPRPPDLWHRGRRSIHGGDGARRRGRGARRSFCGGLASGASAVKTELERQRGRVWSAGWRWRRCGEGGSGGFEAGRKMPLPTARIQESGRSGALGGRQRDGLQLEGTKRSLPFLWNARPRL